MSDYRRLLELRRVLRAVESSPVNQSISAAVASPSGSGGTAPWRPHVWEDAAALGATVCVPPVRVSIEQKDAATVEVEKEEGPRPPDTDRTSLAVFKFDESAMGETSSPFRTAPSVDSTLPRTPFFQKSTVSGTLPTRLHARSLNVYCCRNRRHRLPTALLVVGLCDGF